MMEDGRKARETSNPSEGSFPAGCFRRTVVTAIGRWGLARFAADFLRLDLAYAEE
jgi:hypothetical protein